MVHTRRYIAYLLAFGVLISLVSLDVQAQTGTCTTGTADGYLEANNVRARILNNGNLFWRGSPDVYEVPRGSGRTSIFNAGLWIGGLVDGEVRMAASRYGPYEFWPGPLDEDGNPPADCAPHDRIYQVTAADLAALDESGIISPRLLEWPWQLGAPVVDGDGDPDNYNLAGGDRPELRGSSTLWWVMNDRGNTHTVTDTEPIGLEVQATAFAGSSSGDLDNTTFYRYKLIYKGTEPLRDTYVSLFVDPDLGNFDDDYIGSDSTKGVGYVYNADDDDEGARGYGAAPPAVGVAFLHGPLADADGLDNDRDGTVDEAGERLQMTSFMYYHGGGCATTCTPQNALHHYNYMQGRWRDGKRLTVGGDGYDFSDTPTNFAFSGNPALKEYWTEFNTDEQGTPVAPSDRTFLASMGPFDMEPGEEEEIGIAIVWARGSDHLDSVTQLLASPVFDGPFPTAAFGSPDPGTAPAEAVELAAPGNGANAQPTNTTLHWQPVAGATTYYLQWASEPVFEAYDQGDADAVSRVTTMEVSDPTFRGDFASNTRYYWRVLPFNAAGPGAMWSSVYTFTTSDQEHNLEGTGFADFTVVANANGPLAEPEGAAADWAGFPGTGRPSGDQQVGGGGWIIHTGDNGSRGSYEAFLSRTVEGRGGWQPVVPYDFEWRFTARCFTAYNANVAEPGCLGWDAFGVRGLDVIPVPFELWRTGIKTPDDTDDDVRLIPYIIDWEADGWGLRDFDHSVSNGNNDPETDMVYFYLPADLTPGESGYNAWEAAALALPTGANGFPAPPSQSDFFETESSGEVMGRFALVNWNGGEIGGPYNQDLPEPGTVFRIATVDPVTPVLSSPANADAGVSTDVTVWWHGSATDVQVALDPSFASPVFEAEPSGSSATVTGLLDGETYYWRAGNIGRWSETWTFTVGGGATNTESDTVPTDFELAQNYPNPFNPVTTFRFGLPQASTATLAVYNMLGQRVAVVADDAFAAGWHTVQWDASELASGVYLYQIQAGAYQTTRRMVLLK